jgi:exonuclease III
MKFGTWNVRSMYKAGSLRAVGEEISKYKLDLVGVQEVRWDGGDTERAGEYTFFYGGAEMKCAVFLHAVST